MLRYETLFLTVPEVTSDEVVAIEEQLQVLVKEHNASVISFERWGKSQLAYAVQNHEYGVYFLVRFEVPAESAYALNEGVKALLAVKHNDTVMRHVISRLDSHASLVYQRPETLEDVPGKMPDVFVKEHRDRDAV